MTVCKILLIQTVPFLNLFLTQGFKEMMTHLEKYYQ